MLTLVHTTGATDAVWT